MGRGFSLVPGGRGTNYTGMLTRSIVFSSVLFIFLATTGMTIAAIIVPNWLIYDSVVGHGKHTSHIHKQLGLHKQCSNTASISPSSSHHHSSENDIHCTPYPRYSDCHAEDRYFCSMWRSVGFLMSFAVVLEGMTIAAFVVLILGGKQKREQGWGFMATMAALAALVQAVGMGIVIYLRDNDDKFSVPGWYLDKSWEMCTASWTLQVLVAIAITLAALCLPSEGGYELIPDSIRQEEEP
ncbi:hypothetical protein LTR64_000161 [Lithohypha guttulata]|uniref:uncharacterized protein n=1 Tax=Lithohypha guttulata TaxID=1690604 RepID=UPI002DDEAE91|nr:hypothetical protein LTR51_007523 [Lithohypha guttulata]